MQPCATTSFLGRMTALALVRAVALTALPMSYPAFAGTIDEWQVPEDKLVASEGAPNPRTMPPHSMHERVFRIPLYNNLNLKLVVTLLTPDGPGPFPLAIMNHGASGSLEPPARQVRYRQTFSAYYFLSRGYAVLLPMMRGYAGSDGDVPKHGCDYGLMGLEEAHDIAAAADAIKDDPSIDASRIIVAGQSFGGWNTLAFGTLGYPGVKGLINFNGGELVSNCNDSERSLVQYADQYAANTRVPSIWFYGDNDTLFSSSTWNAMKAAYLGRGGYVELYDVGKVFKDSHQFLSYPQALVQWTPRVDAFLQKLGLPYANINPYYLPSKWPTRSGFAGVDDVLGVPYLSDAGRELYRKFLQHESPRAIAISPKGDVSAAFGGFDQAASALQSCGRNGHTCRLYAIDNDVVWQPVPPAPSPSGYAGLEDTNAVNFLGATRADFYTKFLSRPAPRALVFGGDGKMYGVYGPEAYAQATVNCEATSQQCRAYVIDNDVVWPRPMGP